MNGKPVPPWLAVLSLMSTAIMIAVINHIIDAMQEVPAEMWGCPL